VMGVLASEGLTPLPGGKGGKKEDDGARRGIIRPPELGEGPTVAPRRSVEWPSLG
jgi:hypothetical protein